MNMETLILITSIWMGMAVLVHVLMFYVTAPFGRHTSDKWGPSINHKLGWFCMELVSLLIMTYFFISGTNSMHSFAWILFCLWIAHYINRTVIYTLRIKSTEKKMPFFIMLNGMFFNVMNAGLNGYFLAECTSPFQYDALWLNSPHFKIGIIMFLLGMYINLKADNHLIGLRKKGDTGYQIPEGFLFKYISSPNLLGEIIEWTGFAVMAWNLPALSFALWTFANLVPRALNHHHWYQKHFADYPKNRKAIFPFIF